MLANKEWTVLDPRGGLEIAEGWRRRKEGRKREEQQQKGIVLITELLTSLLYNVPFIFRV